MSRAAFTRTPRPKPAGRIDTGRVDATTEADIAKHKAADEVDAMLDAAKFARRVRHRLGFSQAEFAERINVSLDTIRNWESQHEHAFALHWNALKGYHVLMRQAHLFKTLARFARHLRGLYRQLGVCGAIAFIRTFCAAPWLVPARMRRLLAQPFHLQRE